LTNLNTNFLVESLGEGKMKSENKQSTIEIEEIKMDTDIRVNKIPTMLGEINLSKFPFISESKENDKLKKYEEIDLLNQRISRITNDVIQLQNDLTKFQENIGEDQNDVDINKIETDELISELKARKSAINWLNGELEKKHNQLKMKENDISEKNLEINSFKNHVHELEASLADKTDMIEKLKGEIKNNDDVQTVNQLDIIKEKQQEIDSLIETVDAKNEIISQMSKELIEKQDVIFEKMKVSGDLKSQLDESEHELIRRMNIISQLRMEVDQDKENIQTVSTSLHNKDMLIKQLQEQLNQNNQIEVHNNHETKISEDITWDKNIENVCNEIDENIKTKKLTDKEMQ
jgi:chromosome segregation ATPase